METPLTSVATPGLDNAPTTHARLLAWVQEMAELTTPDQVVWVDGSDEEWERLTGKLVEAGTFRRLDAKPNSFWCASDPRDVARVEDRTYICSVDEADAGPTNNWMEPAEMDEVVVADDPVGDGVLAHRGDHEPVGQRQSADDQGREQGRRSHQMEATRLPTRVFRPQQQTS